MALSLAEIGRQHPVVGPDDPDTVTQKLIRPSLMARPLIDEGRPILDVGSGVGLPGLPLALSAPAHPVILAEPRSRCIGLIHWLLNKLPPLNVRVLQARAEHLARHTLPPHQVLTRAALDWEALARFFYPESPPILRWSGPEVDCPPDRADWTHQRLRVSWQNHRQEFFWWGPEALFHVKQSAWDPAVVQPA